MPCDILQHNKQPQILLIQTEYLQYTDSIGYWRGPTKQSGSCMTLLRFLSPGILHFWQTESKERRFLYSLAVLREYEVSKSIYSLTKFNNHKEINTFQWRMNIVQKWTIFMLWSFWWRFRSSQHIKYLLKSTGKLAKIKSKFGIWKKISQLWNKHIS